MWQDLPGQIKAGDFKALARCISLVENEQEGYWPFLKGLDAGEAGIVGVTGPPGAGKSTMVDALIGEWVNAGKKIAVLCIDPSSPFHFGALLGDRIRMSQWYNNPNVFIRSLANRGNLGGLNPMIIEIISVLRAADFDHIIVETVGIGQSEVEIAGLADLTVVVLVPEAGDEIQTMKAGMMEIADIFVVNKSDRPDSDHFVKNLRSMLGHKQTPVIKTVASEGLGIDELAKYIILALQQDQPSNSRSGERRKALFAGKVWHILQRLAMK